MHVATISPAIDPHPEDPSRVIDPVVNGTRYILQSAAAEPSVKSFVLTSSSFAAVFREKNWARKLDEDSWNEESVEKAYSLPLDDPKKVSHIYAASKTLSERAAWDFYKEERPSFIVNTVIPNYNIGPTIGPQAPRSSGEWINQAVSGDMSGLKALHLRNSYLLLKDDSTADRCFHSVVRRRTRHRGAARPRIGFARIVVRRHPHVGRVGPVQRKRYFACPARAVSSEDVPSRLPRS